MGQKASTPANDEPDAASNSEASTSTAIVSERRRVVNAGVVKNTEVELTASASENEDPLKSWAKMAARPKEHVENLLQQVKEKESSQEIISSTTQSKGGVRKGNFTTNFLEVINSGKVHKYEIKYSGENTKFKEQEILREKRTNDRKVLSAFLQTKYRNSELPRVPWMEDLVLPMDGNYVEPMMLERSGSGRTDETKPLLLRDLLQPTPSGVRPYRILIEGAQGYGKTTVAYKIASDWAKRRKYLLQFDVVLLLPLKNFHLFSNLVDMVLQECKMTELESKDIIEALELSPEKTLLILDGYDEMNPDSQEQFQDAIAQQISPLTTAMLTSRILAENTIEMHFYKKVIIKGFDKQQRLDFVNRFFDGEAEQETVSKFVEETVLLQLFECPMLLSFFCILINDNVLEIPCPSIRVFQDMLDFMVLRTLQKDKDVFEVDLFARRQEKALPENISVILYWLGSLMMPSSQNRRYFIEEELLEKCKDEMVLKIGIVSKTTVMIKKRRCVRYEIIHNSFQNFLWVYYWTISTTWNPALIINTFSDQFLGAEYKLTTSLFVFLHDFASQLNHDLQEYVQKMTKSLSEEIYIYLLLNLFQDKGQSDESKNVLLPYLKKTWEITVLISNGIAYLSELNLNNFPEETYRSFMEFVLQTGVIEEMKICFESTFLRNVTPEEDRELSRYLPEGFHLCPLIILEASDCEQNTDAVMSVLTVLKPQCLRIVGKLDARCIGSFFVEMTEKSIMLKRLELKELYFTEENTLQLIGYIKEMKVEELCVEQVFQVVVRSIKDLDDSDMKKVLSFYMKEATRDVLKDGSEISHSTLQTMFDNVSINQKKRKEQSASDDNLVADNATSLFTNIFKMTSDSLKPLYAPVIAEGSLINSTEAASITEVVSSSSIIDSERANVEEIASDTIACLMNDKAPTSNYEAAVMTEISETTPSLLIKETAEKLVELNNNFSQNDSITTEDIERGLICLQSITQSVDTFQPTSSMQISVLQDILDGMSFLQNSLEPENNPSTLDLSSEQIDQLNKLTKGLYQLQNPEVLNGKYEANREATSDGDANSRQIMAVVEGFLEGCSNALELTFTKGLPLLQELKDKVDRIKRPQICILASLVDALPIFSLRTLELRDNRLPPDVVTVLCDNVIKCQLLQNLHFEENVTPTQILLSKEFGLGSCCKKWRRLEFHGVEVISLSEQANPIIKTEELILKGPIENELQSSQILSMFEVRTLHCEGEYLQGNLNGWVGLQTITELCIHDECMDEYIPILTYLSNLEILRWLWTSQPSKKSDFEVWAIVLQEKQLQLLEIKTSSFEIFPKAIWWLWCLAVCCLSSEENPNTEDQRNHADSYRKNVHLPLKTVELTLLKDKPTEDIGLIYAKVLFPKESLSIIMPTLCSEFRDPEDVVTAYRLEEDLKQALDFTQKDTALSYSWIFNQK